MQDIRSALRPANDLDAQHEVRALHSQYDSLFKAIVNGGWANESDGDVAAPSGAFALITIEHVEAPSVWGAFGNEDYLTEGQLLWMWSGQLAGYYVTVENSDGIITVWTYDSPEGARNAFNGLEAQFGQWWADKSKAEADAE